MNKPRVGFGGDVGGPSLLTSPSWGPVDRITCTTKTFSSFAHVLDVKNSSFPEDLYDGISFSENSVSMISLND